MKIKTQIGFIALTAMLLLNACHKEDEVLFDTPVVGHWGCEQYVSHRVDTTAAINRWDTSWFDASAGGDYEVFFYNTGRGQLKLNNSPAYIKEFSCDYVYDSVDQVIRIESSSWLLGIYGSLLHNEKSATFEVEVLNDTVLVASWTNHVSETIPFFERFFLKRID